MLHNNRTIRHIRNVTVLLVTFVCLLAVSASAAERLRTPEPPLQQHRPRPQTQARPQAYVPGPSVARALAAPRVYRGLGFDTCKTPSVATMRAWLRSNYKAIGVYYAGRARACRTQRNLTAAWVRSVSGMGWRIMPVYVGSQSPCVRNKNKKKYRMSSRSPGPNGTREGRDAVNRARALGFGAGSPLYLDMEAYDTRRTKCTRPTLLFVRAFNREVHRQGYLAGFYSSAASGIAHIERARRSGVRDMPDIIWYARWKVTPTLDFEPVLDRWAWLPHRRIHQYAGNVKERYGGKGLHIDRNRLDAPVAVVAR
jgi:hypothetical protein